MIKSAAVASTRQRERELRRHQRAAQHLRRSPDPDLAVAAANGGREVTPEERERRIQSDNHAGDERQRRGKRNRPRVNACLAQPWHWRSDRNEPSEH